MKHMQTPMEVRWYYVECCDCYFPYIEHRPNGILLDGSWKGLPPFVVPENACRRASYEEVNLYYIHKAKTAAMSSESPSIYGGDFSVAV